MDVAIIGSGYVGLVAGACFAEMGNNVVCVDVNVKRIEGLNRGVIPIFEPGLEDLILENVARGSLRFTTKLESVLDVVEIVFIAVGTPMGEDGSADLQYVKQVAKELGRNMMKSLIIVNKSTVPVGTADKVKSIVQEELALRDLTIDFDVVSNPEFLKEGDAINDFMKPDRVVIGADNDLAFFKVRQLYSSFFRTHERFIKMEVRSAEMTKYAANAMLATKISFMNEIANICEEVGADANQVRVGIGSDKRIGYSFIYPGIGYGGTCFPKDISALIKLGKDNGYQSTLLSSVDSVNRNQKKRFLDKIIGHFGDDLSSFVFAVWGLSFKPETDDMREAPSLYIIKELVRRGARIKVYDPKAMTVAKEYYLMNLNKIEYFESKYDVLKKSDALILLTEWKEFRSPDFNEIKKLLNSAVIFDGRNQYSSSELKKRGFSYFQIGK